jgi:hypothetical protein
MQAASASETSAGFYQTTRPNNPGHSRLQVTYNLLILLVINIHADRQHFINTKAFRRKRAIYKTLRSDIFITLFYTSNQIQQDTLKMACGCSQIK